MPKEEIISHRNKIELTPRVDPHQYGRMAVMLARLDVVKELLQKEPVRDSFDYFGIDYYGEKTARMSRSLALTLMNGKQLDDTDYGDYRYPGFRVLQARHIGGLAYNIDVTDSESVFIIDRLGSMTSVRTPQTVLEQFSDDHVINRFEHRTNVAFNFVMRHAQKVL